MIFQDKGFVLRRQLQTTVYSQCYSPCGKFLATGDKFGYVSLFKYEVQFSTNRRSYDVCEILSCWLSVGFLFLMHQNHLAVPGNHEQWCLEGIAESILVHSFQCLLASLFSLPAALGPDADEETLKPVYVFKGNSVSYSWILSCCKRYKCECLLVVLANLLGRLFPMHLQCTSVEFTPWYQRTIFSSCKIILCLSAFNLFESHAFDDDQNGKWASFTDWFSGATENTTGWTAVVLCLNSRSGSGSIQAFVWSDILTKVNGDRVNFNPENLRFHNASWGFLQNTLNLQESNTRNFWGTEKVVLE